MICPHCGKDTDIQPVPVTNLLFNNVACAAQPTIYPATVVANGNSFTWLNNACAAGAAQPVGTITHYITLGGNAHE